MKPRHLSFHYTLRNPAGRVLDTSQGGEPLTCIEGSGEMIEGLESALREMKVGERRSVVVPPERAYGARDPGLIQKVPRRLLPAEEIRVGDRFQTGADRQAPVVTIAAIDGDDVVLDANHPLAGEELHFEVELLSVGPAAAAELPPPEHPA